jgi:surface protein
MQSTSTLIRTVHQTACEAGTIYDWPIGNWCVSQVTDMSDLFKDAVDFNENLWSDVSNVITMKGMFSGAASYDQHMSSWDVSRVTDMCKMFNGAASFNSSIGAWNVPNVTNMEGMFFEAKSFDQDISDWDLSSVVDMLPSTSYLFQLFLQTSKLLSRCTISSGVRFAGNDDDGRINAHKLQQRMKLQIILLCRHNLHQLR